MAALRPHLKLSTSFRASAGGTIDHSQFSSVADAEVALAYDRVASLADQLGGFPEGDAYWEDRLDHLTSTLRQVFDLFAAVGEADINFDHSAVQRPSIPPHEQNRFHADWGKLFDLIWQGWTSVDAHDAAASRHWVERWRRTPFLGFRRLALAAVGHSPHFSPSEKLEALLNG